MTLGPNWLNCPLSDSRRLGNIIISVLSLSPFLCFCPFLINQMLVFYFMNETPTLNKVYTQNFDAVVCTLQLAQQTKEQFNRQVWESKERGRWSLTVQTVWELSSISTKQEVERNATETSKRWEREKRNLLKTPKPPECPIKNFASLRRLTLLCTSFSLCRFVVVIAISSQMLLFIQWGS